MNIIILCFPSSQPSSDKILEPTFPGILEFTEMRCLSLKKLINICFGNIKIPCVSFVQVTDVKVPEFFFIMGNYEYFLTFFLLEG